MWSLWCRLLCVNKRMTVLFARTKSMQFPCTTLNKPNHSRGLRWWTIVFIQWVGILLTVRSYQFSYWRVTKRQLVSYWSLNKNPYIKITTLCQIFIFNQKYFARLLQVLGLFISAAVGCVDDLVLLCRLVRYKDTLTKTSGLWTWPSGWRKCLSRHILTNSSIYNYIKILWWGSDPKPVTLRMQDWLNFASYFYWEVISTWILHCY